MMGIILTEVCMKFWSPLILAGIMTGILTMFPLGAGSALAAENAVSLPDTPIKMLERRSPVVVEHEGNDSIGARLATRLKELFNSSNLFLLENKDVPKLCVYISTKPEFESRPGVGSAYAVVWAFSQSENTLRHYLGRDVGLLSPDEVNDLAAKIVERTDSMATKFGYLFPEKQQ